MYVAPSGDQRLFKENISGGDTQWNCILGQVFGANIAAEKLENKNVFLQYVQV